MTDVLIIEDNAGIAEGLRENLEEEGYSVAVAADGEQGLLSARRLRPGLVVLDLMLPRIDGFHVLRRMRDEGLQMPVLILSALGGEAEKVRGFRIGADDYVTKPFGLRELLARVDALFRRRRMAGPGPSGAAPDRPVRFGDIEVRLASHEVQRAGRPVELRPKEFELLRALLDRTNTVVSRQELLTMVWGYGADVVSRTVDSHVLELRRKLEADPAHPRFILTIRKTGYMIRVTDTSKKDGSS